MAINSIKIELIIIGICSLIGFRSVVICGSTSKIGGGLVSYEEDNRTSDVNYLDMPAAAAEGGKGENRVWCYVLFGIIFFISAVVSAFILFESGQNSKNIKNL